MKNEKDEKGKNSNFLKENGFLIALYSLVGVLVVVALSLTFFMPSAKIQSGDTLLSIEDSKNVSNNLAKSYKTQVETDATATNDSALDTTTSSQEAVSEIGTAVSESASNTVTTEPSVPSTPDYTSVVNTTEDKTANIVVFEDDGVLKSAQPTNVLKATFGEAEYELVENDGEAEDSDTSVSTNGYSEGEKMLWPTKGDVVSVFSNNSLVYDKTLDQYRTNDSIDISAEKGQDVFSAYDGVVKTVSNSVENGNYVVVDHGNGWVTTYSQLNDGMKVSEGDVIKKGQQIGVIEAPTNRSVLLGTHLDFKVTKDNVSVDPLYVLE